MTTIKLFDKYGRALTDITSGDERICLPHEIHLHDDGTATASHPSNGDYDFESLDELCADYQIDPAAVHRLRD